MRYVFSVPQILRHFDAFFCNLSAIRPQTALEFGKQKHSINLTFEWPKSWVDIHDKSLQVISKFVHIEHFLWHLVD